MPGFKNRFYETYYSSHIVRRKGKATPQQFEQRARQYDRVWGRLLPADRNAKILDIGCGNGSLVWWMQKRGYENSGGIDVSVEQVRVAQELGVRNIVQADLEDFIRTQSDQFDVLVLRDVLEHFDRESIVSTLDLCRGALKKGGRLIAQVPNAETPFGGRIRYGDFTHELAFTWSSLEQLMAVCGFDVLGFYPAGRVAPKLGRATPHFLLWKGVEAFYRLLLYAETGRRRAIVTESIIVVAAPREAAPPQV